MGLIAFLGSGLFVSELARNRRLAVDHAQQTFRKTGLRTRSQLVRVARERYSREL
jgi:hypothetical protein